LAVRQLPVKVEANGTNLAAKLAAEFPRLEVFAMLPIETILCPTDFSPPSAAAFSLACALARDHGARLLVLNVVRPPLSALGGTQFVPPTSEEYGVREAEQQLHALRPPAETVPVEYLLREGDPAAEIVGLAAEKPCQMIVMGTHGRGPLGRLLLGSVAEAVMRRAACPVLTVKTPVPGVAPPPTVCREPAAV
jgi:nucleotide-binding universal stress UspA family protein